MVELGSRGHQSAVLLAARHGGGAGVVMEELWNPPEPGARATCRHCLFLIEWNPSTLRFGAWVHPSTSTGPWCRWDHWMRAEPVR